MGVVWVEDGFLKWVVKEGEMPPDGATLKKWFHIEPCTWTDTDLIERWWVEGVMMDERIVHFDKTPPDLWIASSWPPEVLPGAEVEFNLSYGNTGGYENNVMIRNEFPPEALFRSEAGT